MHDKRQERITTETAAICRRQVRRDSRELDFFELFPKTALRRVHIYTSTHLVAVSRIYTNNNGIFHQPAQ